MLDFYFPAVHIDLARRNAADTEYAFHQLGSLRSYQTAESEDLPLAQGKAHILEGFGVNGTQIFDLHNDLTGRAFPRRIYIRQLTSDHLCNNLIGA